MDILTLEQFISDVTRLRSELGEMNVGTMSEIYNLYLNGLNLTYTIHRTEEIDEAQRKAMSGFSTNGIGGIA